MPLPNADMTGLHETRILISSLSSNELKILFIYFEAFDHAVECKELLHAIAKKNESAITELRQAYTADKFSKLITHFYPLVLDALSLDSNLQDEEVYAKPSRLILTLRKNIIHAHILGNKGLINDAIQVFNKNIRVAKEFGYYDEALVCMYDLLNIYSVSAEHEKFRLLRDEIMHYEKLRSHLKEIFIAYNKFTLEFNINPGDKSLIQEIANEIPKFKTYFDENPSAFMGWFYYRILIEHYFVSNNYTDGYKSTLDLIAHQKKYITISNENYLAISYKMAARSCIQLWKLDEALSYIQKSKKLRRQHKKNIELLNQVEFYVHFYQGNFGKAYHAINHIENDSKNSYFIQCCKFFQGQVKPDDNHDTRKIEKDKDGWNIYVRLLQIMKSIDLKKVDLAKAYIERLRKHVQRLNPKQDIDPRLTIIIKTLRELEKTTSFFQAP